MSDPILLVGREYPDFIMKCIESAQSSIDVIAYDWRWYPSVQGSSVSLFNAAILKAAKRGVRVRVLVNNDMVCMRLNTEGVTAKRSRSSKLLHTKMLIFDNTKVSLGSHNLTQNAFALNEEASVCFSVDNSQNAFQRYFEALWGI